MFIKFYVTVTILNAMRFGFCGLGLIGMQRLEGLNELRLSMSELPIEIIGHYDPKVSLASRSDIVVGESAESLEQLLEMRPDLLFVSTPHDAVLNTCRKAIQHGIRVHVEKPLGRNLNEAIELSALDPMGHMLTVGFNYRFFRGIEKILKDFHQGVFGEIISIEMTMGHGGAPEDRTSWKLSPDSAGGGSLLDPGVHLLDLCLQIEPELSIQHATTWSGFWNTGIEEEVMVILKSERIPSIVVISSVVRWRSEFRLRVSGTEGYGNVSGRGRSYGIQQYTRGKRWGWMQGVSQTQSEELICEDPCTDSFQREMSQILSPDPLLPSVANGSDGLRVMELVDRIYKQM